LKAELGKVTEEDLIKAFQKEIKDDPDNASDHRLNLVLYALSVRKPDAAMATLEGMTLTDHETVDMLRAIALEQKGFLDEAIAKLIHLLGENEFNRYNNVNLGLMYRKARKRFLATKYLIKTAALLNKSNGIYSMKELLKEAEETYDQGNLKKALNYFLIAASEVPTADIWSKIGSIYVEQKKYDDAAEAYRAMKRLDPNSAAAEIKLKEIHDYYLERGEVLFEERKFKPAVDYYHKALGALRIPETIKKTADAYKQLNNPDKEKELLEEWQRLIDEEKAREQETHRQKLITKGKQYLAQKDYRRAIEVYEQIFRMKVDRKIFMQLAALYKGLKKRDELSGLEKRWERMVLHEEKMRKFERDKEREQLAESEKDVS
jgi:tetratricopeptide (TPR) repeat protein